MKKLLSLFMVIAMVLTMAPITVIANDKEVAQEDAIEAISEQFQDPSNDPFNYRTSSMRKNAINENYPESFDLRNVDTDDDGTGDTSYVTPVKFQNPFGTCWGFAAIAAAESSILGDNLTTYNADTLDLSEKHLVYFVGNAIDDPNNSQYGEGTHAAKGVTLQEKLNGGGMPFFATSLFASGIGPVLENTNPALAYKGKNGSVEYVTKTVDGVKKAVPYCYDDEDDWSLPEELRFQNSFTLKESYMLPSPAEVDEETGEYSYNEAGTNAIKKMLMEKRAVQIGFCADTSQPSQEAGDGQYISKNWAHYTYDSNESANHAVAIVGWDDNYPKENFVEDHNPPADGAWLVKNSWGSEEEEFPNRGPGWGIENNNGEGTGYFWLSYYDKTIGMPEALEFDKESSDEYIIDSYDYMPVNDVSGAAIDTEIKMANVFKADFNEQLEQVSCETTYPGTTVVNEVYLLASDFKDPTDGILVSRQESQFEFGGFHKISLNEPIFIQKDQSYAIVQTQKTTDGDYAFNIPISYGKEFSEFMGMNTWTEGVINKNETFIYSEGKWSDYSTQEFRDSFFGEMSIILSFDNFPIKGYCKKCDSNIKISVNGESAFNLIEGEDTNNFRVRFKGTGGEAAFDAPDIHWALSDGGDKYFTLIPNENDPYSASVKVLDYGKAYLKVTADGIGTTVIPLTVNKREIYVLSVFTEGEIYNGKPHCPKVEVEDDFGNVIPPSEYTVTYKNNVKVGTAQVIITAKPSSIKYTGSIDTDFEILKAANTLNVKGKTKALSYKKLTKKNLTFGITNVINFKNKGQGTKVYALASAKNGKKNFKKYFGVNKSTGKVTVKKGLKKGTYTVKIKVKAKGNANYKASKVKTVTCKVKVK